MILSTILDQWRRLKLWLSRPLYRNSLYLITNIALTSLLGFFFWLIVAKLYSDVEVGYSSAIISALNLLALLSGLGFGTSIIRFLPGSDKQNNLINTVFSFSGITGIAVAVIFLLGVNIWAPDIKFINNNIVFILTFVAIAPMAIISLLCNSVFISGRKSVFTLFKDVGASVIKIILALGFAFNFHSFGIVASWGLALSAGIAVSFWIFIPRIYAVYKPRINIDTGLIKKMWSYSGKSYISALLYNAPIQILPLMVLGIAGVQSNAYYYIAWMIANLLFAVPAAISHSLFAELTNFPNSITVKRNLVRSLKFVYLIVGPALMVVLIASQWLLGAFGQAYVDNGLLLLRILALTSLFMAFSFIYSSLLQALDRMNELIIFRVLSTVLILSVSYFILPYTGIIGIGYVWGGVQFVVALVSLIRLYYWMRKLPV